MTPVGVAGPGPPPPPPDPAVDVPPVPGDEAADDMRAE